MIECSVNNITKFFGANKIFENISFDVKTGERIGLIGQNGCGKSTLMKIIIGEEDYQEGEIAIRKNATVGYLEQMPSYSDSYTALDIMYLAFSNIHHMKGQIKVLEKKLQSLEGESLNKALREYGELSDSFEREGGYDIDTKISKITAGLKINEQMQDMPFKQLSGGEKTRVILAKILLEQPDVLLLDEPSNHLDLSSIEWLEEFLKGYKGAVVIVSHDRYFLDRVVNKIVEMEFDKTNLYHGNYSYYVVEKERRFLIAYKFYMNQQKKIKSMEKQIERYRIWGVMRDSNKMFIRAKELEKRLEKIEKVDKPVFEKKRIKLTGDIGSRSGKRVLVIENLYKRFDEKDLLENVWLTVFYGDSLCILGDNGSGKTTLLKLIMNELQLDKGSIKLGSNTVLGYLPQIVEFEDESKTICEYFQYRYNITISEARNELAKVLFIKEDVNKKIKSLSGGEKSRLKLCCLIYEKVNVMILDEPTNHLDIESREVLEELLVDYDGTIIFVSHDRYFIAKVADKITAINNKTLKFYNGDYDYYKEELAKINDSVEEPTVKEEKKSKLINTTISKNKSSKNDKFKVEKLIDIESKIEKLEEEMMQIEEDMLRYGDDAEKLNELFAAKEQKSKIIKGYYEEWEQ